MLDCNQVMYQILHVLPSLGVQREAKEALVLCLATVKHVTLPKSRVEYTIRTH